MGKVVGIDLGTTNSVVAVMEGGKPVVIANAEGMRTTPSVVAFSKEGEKLIGQMARRQSVLNPQNTFYAVKRFVGRKYDELSSDSKRVPYTVRRNEAGNVKIRCPRLDKDFAPEEISAMILRKLAEEASQYLGQPVTGAVITVPAYFNDSQRQATRDAGRIAGLEVKRIINEPTAASLAYGLDQQFNQTILVFDLGGGTFDVSVLDVGDGVFEVRSTSGDTQLGGLNFDKVIVDWLADDFLEREGVDLRRDRQSLQRLSEAAEKAKIELSGVPVTEINLPFITATKDGPKHIETKLERSHFESLCGDLVSRMRGPLKQALADANVTPSQVDEVVLVGGASRMPMVQDLVRSVMNREPNKNVNPDEVVAVGAAIQAGILTQEVKDILLLDVSPLSLGLETVGGVMKKLIPRNTTIPVRRSDTFSTSENNQTVVEVHILQGEREMVDDNKSLGRFKLMGIPPAPRGIPQVQVSFDIDANGILQVSALDKTTGRQQSITVQEASNLSEDEIQDMIRAAEENAATDRLQRDRIEKRNRAEALTFKAERVLREVAIDFGMQFGRDRRRRIENLIQELRAALEQSDDRGIDLFQSDLQNEVYELNREAYLYDLDDDGDGILSQIGGTLKRAFAGEDDDYYRTDDYGYGAGSGYGTSYPANNPYGRQAQWDAPSWNQGGTAASGGNWDDWGDDWDGSPRQTPTAPGYNQPVSPSMPPSVPGGSSRYQNTGYGADVYGRDNGGAYDSPPDNRSDSRYGRQDSYDRTSAYDARQAEPRPGYGQNDYAQGGSSQGGSSQGGYERNNYDQGGYDQGGYDQGGYRKPQPQLESYGDSKRNDDYGRSQNGGYPPAPRQSEYGQPAAYNDQQYDQRDGYGSAQPGDYPQDGYRQDASRPDDYRQSDYRQDEYRQDRYRGDARQPDYRQSDSSQSGYRSDDGQGSYRSDDNPPPNDYPPNDYRPNDYPPDDYGQGGRPRDRTNEGEYRAPESTPRRSERETDDYWQRRPQPERDSRNTEDDWF